MKSIICSLAVVVLATSFASLACAETMYLDRRTNGTPYTGVLESRNMSDGSLVYTYDNAISGQPEGVALSPDGSTLYMGLIDGSGYVKSYNVATGALLNTYTVATGNIRGVASDSAGNVYAANYVSGTIAKIKISDGTVDQSWGSAFATGKVVADIEVKGDTLYGLSTSSGYAGFYAWDLASGGSPTKLGTVTTRGTFTLDANDKLYVGAGPKIEDWGTDYTSATTLVDFGGTTAVSDIDFVDGSIYACLRLTSSGATTGTGSVVKVDPSDGSYVTLATFTNNEYFPRWVVCESVPEPSTLALLACGLVGLLAYAWRKRK